MARSLGLGGATGLGSVVYSLSLTGELLGSEELIADAVLVAGLITPELLSADHSFDVISGSAGAILALCRLHRQTRLAAILEKAMECGDHLLRNADITLGAIPQFSSLLTGSAHGAAGIALALSLLYERCGEERFAAAAKDLVSYENSLFSVDHLNWPDLRGQARELRFPCQWCYGGAGIGLSRIGMLRSASGGEEALLTDIRYAVQCSLATPSINDTLCCGDLGIIEFLHEAANALGETTLRDDATAWLEGLIHEAEARGDYRWVGGTRQFSLGLFRGMAGIGYVALRRLNPNLPNILLWS
jgi:lantibiotic modifying enzyme